jgi:hypothetical protein
MRQASRPLRAHAPPEIATCNEHINPKLKEASEEAMDELLEQARSIYEGEIVCQTPSKRIFPVPLSNAKISIGLPRPTTS